MTAFLKQSKGLPVCGQTIRPGIKPGPLGRFQSYKKVIVSLWTSSLRGGDPPATCQEARPPHRTEILSEIPLMFLDLTCSVCNGLFAFPRLLSSTLLPLYCPQITRFTRQGQQTHPDLFHQSHRGNPEIKDVRASICNVWLQMGSASFLSHSCSFFLICPALFSLLFTPPVSFPFVLLIPCFSFL